MPARRPAGLHHGLQQNSKGYGLEAADYGKADPAIAARVLGAEPREHCRPCNCPGCCIRPCHRVFREGWMKFALVNPNWDFKGSTYFGCKEPHVPLELMFAHDQIL